MKISCIAVDDEPLALEILEAYIKKIPYLRLCKLFYNAIDTIEYLKENKIDLLFLDIQMEELTGVQLLSILANKPLVIFTTAYDKYALQGYELDVVDYLLKPISFDRFLKAIDKVYGRIQLSSPKQNILYETSVNSKKKKFFFVKSESRLVKINFDDILFIEGMADYLGIVTTKGKILTLQNFKNMEEQLPPDNFCRVHKSFIVSLDKINSIERNRIKIGNQIIPISDTYLKAFYKLLNNKNPLN